MLVKFFIEVDKVVDGEGHSLMDSGDYLKPAGRHDVDTSPHKADAISFSSQADADFYIAGMPSYDSNWRGTGKKVLYGFRVVRVEFKYANMFGWSDVYPFEIIRVVSDKTIEVRAMLAEKDPDWKPEIISGGFAGHCTNQNDQTYTYKSCDEGQVLRVRLGKKGWKSAMGKHVISEQPRKFYDYNF
jgi:hypothetical protein